MYAVENVHTFETSNDWDEEIKMEDEKEVVNTLHKEEENFQHNKENTEEKTSLGEETLVNSMKEVETFSKEKEVNYLKTRIFHKTETNKTNTKSVQLGCF